LALGIGVNATVFTFVNAVLIRGLPINDPDRVMVVGTRDARLRDRGMSYLDFEDYRRAARTFSGLAAFSGSIMNVSDEGRTPERFQGPFISATAFKLIGQRPQLGRDFLPEDDRPGAPAVVVLGNGIWKNRYGSDPAIIGRSIKINDIVSTVIGVMPEGFKFPNNADLWLPLAHMPRLAEQKRDNRNVEAFGKLADGVTRQQAQSEMNTIAGQLRHDYPDTNKDVTASVMTFNERQNGGPIRLVFLSLMGAVAFVLLIACANVANLLLARSATRAREMSVRISLGATRWRIVRQLLVESVLLSIVSGLFGLALAYVGVRLFDAATQDVGKPYWIQFTMDAQVFALLRGGLPGHRNRVRSCAGAARVEDRSQRSAQGRRPLGQQRRQGPPLDQRPDRCRARVDAGAACRRRLDDAELPHALPTGRRRGHGTSPDDAPGAASAEVSND
jgi:predicted permease